MYARPAGAQDGFTLVELVISMVVISVAVSGVLLMSSQAARYSADPMVQAQALAIAESYLEEIHAQPYRDPDDGGICTNFEADRADFNDICDYDNLDDNGAQGRDGNPIAGLGGYRVRVMIDRNVTLAGVSGQARILGIRVRVDHGGLNAPLILGAYRSNF